MTAEATGPDDAANLRRLQQELAARGVTSELDTRAAHPRLRVCGSAEPVPDVAEFENSIVVAWFGHDSWYAWPWAEPISRVADTATAADEVCYVLGPHGEDVTPGA